MPASYFTADRQIEPTEDLEQIYEYVYRNEKGSAVWLMLLALLLFGIGFLLEPDHAVFVFGLAMVLIVMSVIVAWDDRIRCCIGESGFYDGRKHYGWEEVCSYKITESREGVSLRYFLCLNLRDGSISRIAISGLQSSTANILLALAEILERT